MSGDGKRCWRGEAWVLRERPGKVPMCVYGELGVKGALPGPPS